MDVPFNMIKKIITLSLLFSYQVNAALTTEKSEPKDDLASFTVINKSNQSSFKVYYNKELEGVASQSLVILNDIYSKLAYNAGLQPSNITWAEVAFVTDENYIPPRNNGSVRWAVTSKVSDMLSKKAIEKLYLFIGHEQTHSIQNVLSCDSPRWFEEGQAMWNELKVSKSWNSQIAIDERLRYEEAYKNLKGDLNLEKWGGIIIKQEAYERQLTEEQKQKIKENPSYSPPGPFSFGPDDIISDESNAEARYFASLTIFEFLESKLGMDNIQLLFKDVYKMKSCESGILTKYIKKEYKLDISNFFEKSTYKSLKQDK
jgi:hypothetical protein